MATEEYTLATRRTEKGVEHFYGGLRQEDIDRLYGEARKQIESAHERVLEMNPRLGSISSEVKLL